MYFLISLLRHSRFLFCVTRASRDALRRDGRYVVSVLSCASDTFVQQLQNIYYKYSPIYIIHLNSHRSRKLNSMLYNNDPYRFTFIALTKNKHNRVPSLRSHSQTIPNTFLSLQARANLIVPERLQERFARVDCPGDSPPWEGHLGPFRTPLPLITPWACMSR